MTKQLKASLKSKDPEKSLLFATWPVAKILRGIKAFAEKRRKLFTIPFTVHPHDMSKM